MEVTKNMNNKHIGFGACLVLIGILFGAFLTWQISNTLNLYGSVGVMSGVNKKRYEVHSRVRIWDGDNLVLDEWNAGVVTDLGDNQTLFKVFGNSSWQYVDIPYLDNATFISIGNDTGTLASTSTVLPNEWNRTAGTISKNTGQSILNVSTTFYPDAGPNTADCIALNFNTTLGANNMWAYDTFTQVTGIDDTFTINVEFQVTVSHT